MPSDGPRKDTFDRHQIRAIADTLRKLAVDAEALVAKMDQEGFEGTLETDGTKRMDDGIRRISRWLGELEDQRRTAGLPPPDRAHGQQKNGTKPRREKPQK